jgi:hypothetical protein
MPESSSSSVLRPSALDPQLFKSAVCPHVPLMLVRQLDAVRVLPFPFVFLGKHFFEPLRLPLRLFLVRACGIMKNEKFLATLVTAKRTHFAESWCRLSRLALFDRHSFH